MTPLSYLKLAGLLVLVGAGGYFAWSHDRAVRAEADARASAAERRLSALELSYQTLSDETIRRTEFDQAIRDTRSQIGHNLDTIQREDPVSRDFLGELLPPGVRDAIRNGADMRSPAAPDGN